MKFSQKHLIASWSVMDIIAIRPNQRFQEWRNLKAFKFTVEITEHFIHFWENKLWLLDVEILEVCSKFLGFNHMTFCLKFRFPDGGQAK